MTSQCWDLEPVAVSVDLVRDGVGDVEHDAYSDSVDELGYRVHAKTTQDSRDATLSGCVAGGDIVFGSGTATVGVLLSGTHTETTLFGG